MEKQDQKVLEEIDLLDFTIKAAKKAIDFSFTILRLAIRKILWIVLFSIIGFILGYNKYKSTPNTYSSEIIIRSNAIDNYFIINSINKLFESKNSSFLVDSIGFSSDQEKTIINVKAEYGLDFNHDNIIDSYAEYLNPYDTLVVRLRDYFKIKVLLNDSKIIPIVQSKLINYLKNDAFISRTNEFRLKEINSSIELIKIEIAKLNDLKYVSVIKKSNTAIQVLEGTELTISSIIDLNNQKLSLEKELAINSEPITIIQNFSPSKQISGKQITTILYRIIRYAILGFIISLLWQNRKSIWLKLRKDNN